MLNWLTVSNEQMLRVNAGKVLATILPLSEGLKIILIMFVMPILVRNDNLFVILTHLGPEI